MHTLHFFNACNKETTFHNCVLYVYKDGYYVAIWCKTFFLSQMRTCNLVGDETESRSGEPVCSSTEIISIHMEFLPRCGKSVTDSRRGSSYL